MKPVKLSGRQQKVFNLLCENQGGFIRRYIRPNNTVCWRVLDLNLNPLANVSDFIVDGLIDKGVLELDKLKQNYILKADTEKYQTIDISNIGLNAEYDRANSVLNK